VKFLELEKQVGNNMTDPIADFIIRIKNATMAGNKSVTAPHSKVKESLANILQKQGCVSKIEVVEKDGKKDLVLTLAEVKGGVVRSIEVKRISKPGRRVYVKAKDIKSAARGLGTVIVSTPSGLMTDREAMAKKLGGEVVCRII
jgi:small subunit ribosomal protein S8